MLCRNFGAGCSTWVCNSRSKCPWKSTRRSRTVGRTAKRILLFAWIQQAGCRDAILLDEEPDVGLVRKVIEQGYAADLSDEEVEQLGRDPFLVAYALAVLDQRCVVTTEASRPSRRRQNRHLPDVCQTLGVKCCDSPAPLFAHPTRYAATASSSNFSPSPGVFGSTNWPFSIAGVSS